jgi:hypothetical protein
VEFAKRENGWIARYFLEDVFTREESTVPYSLFLESLKIKNKKK